MRTVCFCLDSLFRHSIWKDIQSIYHMRDIYSKYGEKILLYEYDEHTLEISFDLENEVGFKYFEWNYLNILNI